MKIRRVNKINVPFENFGKPFADYSCPHRRTVDGVEQLLHLCSHENPAGSSVVLLRKMVHAATDNVWEVLNLEWAWHSHMGVSIGSTVLEAEAAKSSSAIAVDGKAAIKSGEAAFASRTARNKDLLNLLLVRKCLVFSSGFPSSIARHSQVCYHVAIGAIRLFAVPAIAHTTPFFHAFRNDTANLLMNRALEHFV